MNETKKANVIIPQVMGEMINAKIEKLAKITPYAKVDTTLQGVPGDTKTVPSWNYIGDAADVAEGVEVGLTQMTASSTTFTIKKAMKAVGITQEAVNSGLGNPIGQAETQLAKAVVGKVDNDLVDAALTATNIYDGSTAVIGYDAVVDAVTKFEDEEDGIEKVMFIHPKQEATLLKDNDFTSADKFVGGVAVNGAIGKIAGCWVKKSKKVSLIKYTVAASGDTGALQVVADTDTPEATEIKAGDVKNVTWDATNKKVVAPAVGDYVLAVTNNYYLCPIIKLEPDSAETEYTEDELPALTIFLKADTSLDTEWFPKKQQTDVTVCKYYGVALTNAAKVVLGQFKA